jgi:hypothetical protein
MVERLDAMTTVATSLLISSKDKRDDNAQYLFKQKRRYWEARSSLVEIDAQDSSTDCYLNFDVKLTESTTSEQDCSESKATADTTTQGCLNNKSRTLSSSVSTSSYRTANDSESSFSSNRRIDGVSNQNNGRTLSEMITHCLVCCWPAVKGEKLHNNCFVAIDVPSSPHSIPMVETSEKQHENVEKQVTNGN